ncbi:hypothetical protein WK66_17235 [Burkholderia ubonensis]|nr:hypothetical protein WK66_17235 [Burkholderia ubonensis]
MRNSEVFMAVQPYTTLVDSEVMVVIHTRAAVGEVRPSDPPRIVHLYHALDGTLLAYFDPALGEERADIQSGMQRMWRKSVKDELDEMDRACGTKVDRADVKAG